MKIRLLVALFLLALLALAGCQVAPVEAPRVIVPPAGPATTAQLDAQTAQLGELGAQLGTQRDLAQRAAGGVFGATDANAHNPAGLPKEATAAQLADAASALPDPTAAQKLDRAKDNARILAGELATVKAEMGQTAGENAALKSGLAASEQRSTAATAQLASVTAAGAKERASAAAALQTQFDDLTHRITAANTRADAAVKAANEKQRTLITWIFFGGAALCAIGAALIGTLGASIPLFGPRAALGFALAAGVLFGLGMAVHIIERMVDEHPFIFWGGLLAVAALVVGAAAFMYANHHHRDLVAAKPA